MAGFRIYVQHLPVLIHLDDAHAIVSADDEFDDLGTLVRMGHPGLCAHAKARQHCHGHQQAGEQDGKDGPGDTGVHSPS